MPALTTPTTRLHTAWLESHDEWGPGPHEDGFGLHPTDEIHSPTGFATWTARLTSDPSGHAYWITEDNRVLGGIALRHGPTELIRRAGHIGYGIRPSARGQGLATWALAQILDKARTTDLTRVLLVCAKDNKASARTIEHNGGIPEVDTHATNTHRYWIDLNTEH
ncbi:GNAT family N-acetyltransferase [Umezawaea sp. Da 62-37]|uniref:GNAT family N-acetyltransferase n=1 Tax=Umezawaea sp. Da 62-37 TaxID=3075927 RepID=UPI0028F71558|nr:GNAT family N-acetyltransferase [Umezawaea sp. Da 62-37]WNV85874.1 GNAT family N-acetyltransferase [Umezawaea sp. Da 62-37]